MKVEFILYVADQAASRDFYAQLLQQAPSLDVPGMTEFDVGSCTLGLMPTSGIARILTPSMPHPDEAAGIPRCELYLKVADADLLHQRGIAIGASEIEAVSLRAWGDRVGYLSDPDGHIIAFASE
ncbi:MAG: hypothetical protein A3D92_02575 [Bacteroidetes bacterium RIFCSPHIGHO2_02_FULL_44_7]|nr:MAG: hypothetical protein A3D92_02575 [Bacteroidetes bacterium RIFCSPHIGHO2_02_FULL_44_7]